MAAVAGRPASGGAGEAQASPTAATEATIREAQAELERAVVKAGLTNDPIRYLLEATSGALGAFLVGIEAMRRPMDAELRATLTAAHSDAMRREGKRLVASNIRRDVPVPRAPEPRDRRRARAPGGAAARGRSVGPAGRRASSRSSS